METVKQGHVHSSFLLEEMWFGEPMRKDSVRKSTTRFWPVVERRDTFQSKKGGSAGCLREAGKCLCGGRLGKTVIKLNGTQIV